MGACSYRMLGPVEEVYAQDEEDFVALLKENQSSHISWFKGKGNGEYQAYKNRSVESSFSLSPDGGFVELKNDGNVVVGYVNGTELNVLKKSQNVRSISNIGRDSDGKIHRALAIDDGIELHLLGLDAWSYFYLSKIKYFGVQEVVLSPNAKLVAATCADGYLRIWDEDRWGGLFDRSPWLGLRKIFFLTPPSSFVLSKNGRLMASCPSEGIQVYDFKDSSNDFLLPDFQAAKSLFF